MKTKIGAIAAQRGFSMIEILVTMLIISLAMLGSAGLQAYSMKTNLGGQFRNQAAFYVTDIIERMESNKAGAIAGSYALAAGTAVPNAITTQCDTGVCSSAQLAAYDLNNWQFGLAAALPQGTGVITQTTAGNPSTYTVQVSWVDRSTDTKYASGVVSTETFAITSSRTIGN